MFEALGEPVQHPCVGDGQGKMAYEGPLSPGRRLVIGPDGLARLYPARSCRPRSLALATPPTRPAMRLFRKAMSS